MLRAYHNTAYLEEKKKYYNTWQKRKKKDVFTPNQIVEKTRKKM